MNAKYIAILSLVFQGIISNLSAQTEKGYKMIGGDVSISFNTSAGEIQSNKGFGYSLNPSYTYFISDRIGIGGSPSISYTRNVWKDESEQSSTIGNAHWFGFNPMIRYYLSNFIFSDLRVGGVWIRSNYTILNNNIREEFNPEWERIFSTEFGVGTNYFINDNVAIESRLYHRRVYRKEMANVESNNPWIQFSLGLQVFID